MKMSTRVERENERGLRTVNREARGTLRRAGLKEGRENVVDPGADRKDGADRDIIFEIGRSVERIDCNTEARLGTEGFRQRRFLGKHRRHGDTAQRAPHQFVGDDVDVLLLIAVGIDAAILAGDACERPVPDQRGKLDRRGGDGLDHLTHRRAMRRPQRGPIEM
jgi:hypothetical protein